MREGLLVSVRDELLVSVRDELFVSVRDELLVSVRLWNWQSSNFQAELAAGEE